MITNKAGDLYRGDRFVKENWFSYGAPEYATAAGTVVDAANDIPENSYQNGEVVSPPDLDAIDPTGSGNHVTLDHGDGEFSMFNHMKTGSVRVKKGDRVRAGQQIGEIGFSGDTFLPHLHYMLVDNADFTRAQGLPSYFDNFERNPRRENPAGETRANRLRRDYSRPSALNASSSQHSAMQWFCASRNPLKIQVSYAPHSVLVVTLYENESEADEDQVIRYLS